MGCVYGTSFELWAAGGLWSLPKATRRHKCSLIILTLYGIQEKRSQRYKCASFGNITGSNGRAPPPHI